MTTANEFEFIRWCEDMPMGDLEATVEQCADLVDRANSTLRTVNWKLEASHRILRKRACLEVSIYLEKEPEAQGKLEAAAAG